MHAVRANERNMLTDALQSRVPYLHVYICTEGGIVGVRFACFHSYSRRILIIGDGMSSAIFLYNV